jgi:hypothetical protein
MLKVDFSDARVKVRGDWTSEGSVLAGTVTSTCHGIEVEIDLESEETPNRVAALVHNAPGGCYAEALVRQPVPITGGVKPNGDVLDYEAYPSKIDRRPLSG